MENSSSCFKKKISRPQHLASLHTESTQCTFQWMNDSNFTEIRIIMAETAQLEFKNCSQDGRNFH